MGVGGLCEALSGRLRRNSQGKYMESRHPVLWSLGVRSKDPRGKHTLHGGTSVSDREDHWVWLWESPPPLPHDVSGEIFLPLVSFVCHSRRL